MGSMNFQGNGILKKESGETLTEVQYSITPGGRSEGRQAFTFEGGALPSPKGKQKPLLVELITNEPLSNLETRNELLLETNDNHCFHLVVVKESLSRKEFTAKGTEVECT
jgi:hypothetical protein